MTHRFKTRRFFVCSRPTPQHQVGSQSTQLASIETGLANQARSGSQALTSIQRTLGAIIEVKAMVSQLTQSVLDLQVSISNVFFLRTLDPTRELPVILEDALGRNIPIPAEWLDSLDWDALQALFECHFKDKKGYSMIQRRSYALEDAAGRKDLPLTTPLSTSLRRGMRITMIMLYGTLYESRPCPRCGRSAQTLPGIEVKW